MQGAVSPLVRPQPAGALLEATGFAVERAGRTVARAERISVEEGETLAILGPNGAGKTSLVLALATLIPARGELRHRGSPIPDPVAFRRRIAVVFQRPLLLDRSVLDNAGMGLAIRGVPATERKGRALAALARFGVGHLAERPAVALSGGEAQRVSLARALATDPQILFLDEPFSALDAPTREALITDLAQVLSERRVTTILVTHDRDEALALADRVAVLIAGRLRQVDRTDAVFSMPIDPEVAAFVGIDNVLPSQVEAVTEEITLLRIASRHVEVAAAPPAGETAPLVLIRPDEIVVARAGEGDERRSTSVRNVLSARVLRVEPLGRLVRVMVDCDFPLVAHVTRQSARDMALRPGDEVTVSFKASSPHLLRRHR